MAGTEDYSFYGNTDNSPFWIKKNETAATSPFAEDVNEHLHHWERRLITPPQISDDRFDEKVVPNPGLGIMRLAAENLLCHPFLVLRRQCQVNVFSKKYHINPLSLIPVVIKLHQRQSITVLWKGIGSALIVKGVTLAVEDIINKITLWPKSIDRNSSLKAIGRHLLLKSVSLAVVVPFYAASVVETVQSDVASEKPGIFDVFEEGFGRFLSWSAPQTGRLLPVWIILCPAVLCGTVYYVTSVLSAGFARWSLESARKRTQRKQGAVSKEMSSIEASDLEMTSRFVGSLTADVLLFPFETVLHRLHIQGTRTIIDNLDTGRSVIPILTRYDGFFDCWTTITREEGRWGLYKGFGALVLQYALQFSIIKGSLFTVSHMGDMFKACNNNQQASPRRTVPYNTSPYTRSPVKSPDSIRSQFNQL